MHSHRLFGQQPRGPSASSLCHRVEPSSGLWRASHRQSQVGGVPAFQLSCMQSIYLPQIWFRDKIVFAETKNLKISGQKDNTF